MANLALARKSPEWRSGLWGFDSFFFGDREQPHRLFIAEALFAMQAWAPTAFFWAVLPKI